MDAESEQARLQARLCAGRARRFVQLSEGPQYTGELSVFNYVLFAVDPFLGESIVNYAYGVIWENLFIHFCYDGNAQLFCAATR